MRCLKCGGQIPSGRYFCDPCGESMEKYPVKPGTPIHLPPRAPKPAPNKKVRAKKAVPPEILVQRQRRSLRILALALVALLIAFFVTAGVTLQLLEQRDRSGSYGNVSRETFQI